MIVEWCVIRYRVMPHDYLDEYEFINGRHYNRVYINATFLLLLLFRFAGPRVSQGFSNVLTQSYRKLSFRMNSPKATDATVILKWRKAVEQTRYIHWQTYAHVLQFNNFLANIASLRSAALSPPSCTTSTTPEPTQRGFLATSTSSSTTRTPTLKSKLSSRLSKNTTLGEGYK